MIKYFVYRQNNSNGEFHINENVTEYVILSAQNACQADVLLQSLVATLKEYLSELTASAVGIGGLGQLRIVRSGSHVRALSVRSILYLNMQFILRSMLSGQRALQYGFMTMA